MNTKQNFYASRYDVAQHYQEIFNLLTASGNRELAETARQMSLQDFKMLYLLAGMFVAPAEGLFPDLLKGLIHELRGTQVYLSADAEHDIAGLGQVLLKRADQAMILDQYQEARWIAEAIKKVMVPELSRTLGEGVYFNVVIKGADNILKRLSQMN